MDAKERGAKLIVVDPRLSEAAAKADLWLRLKPGSDTDLALGVISAVIREKLCDFDFIRDWTRGFDALAESVSWRTPEITQKLTGVPAILVVEAARLYAGPHPACISRCVSVDQTSDSIQTCRALSILSAITGNVDVPGGNVAVSARGERSQNTHDFILADRISPESLKDRSGYATYPLLCGPLSPVPSNHMPSFWEQVATGKPYQIKAALIFGSNAAVSYTNSKRVVEGIGKFEFLAVCDQFMTETARLADIVLPASSWLERDNVISSFQTSNEHTVLQRACTAIGESRSDVAILSDLAERLGLGDLFWKDPRDLYDYLLEPTGLSFAQALEKRRLSAPLVFGASRKSGFKTPSGKVELYSSLLEANGVEPIPSGTPKEKALDSDTPRDPKAEIYPFEFSTGARSIFFRHTENRRNPWLISREPKPLVYLNDKTAERLGVAEGELVEVITPTGSARLHARLDPSVDEDFVQAVPGWEGEGNINSALGWENCAKGIGTVPMRGLKCGIRKVGHDR
jgi:anaerobic selenocysteine-containing dehydrogenase